MGLLDATPDHWLEFYPRAVQNRRPNDGGADAAYDPAPSWLPRSLPQRAPLSLAGPGLAAKSLNGGNADATDIPLYYGSGEEFSSLKAVPTTAAGMELPGVSLALDPRLANEDAAARGSGQTYPQVYPLFHRAERPTSLTLDGSETQGEVVATLRDAFDAGHDAVMIKNYTTPGGLGGQNIIIVRDAWPRMTAVQAAILRDDRLRSAQPVSSG